MHKIDYTLVCLLCFFLRLLCHISHGSTLCPPPHTTPPVQYSQSSGAAGPCPRCGGEVCGSGEEGGFRGPRWGLPQAWAGFGELTCCVALIHHRGSRWPLCLHWQRGFDFLETMVRRSEIKKKRKKQPTLASSLSMIFGK